MARVSFGQPEGARDPLVDEKEVMRTFHKHVQRCDTCHSALNAWRSGAPLCSRGHNYVIDMRPYFFCKSGKPYSLVDRERRNEQTRVFVPVEYQNVATLFEALNAGYISNPSRQQKSRPKAVVHQPAQIKPQLESRRPERPTVVIPTKSYHSSRPSARSERYNEERKYREPRSRGSLFQEDEKRRNRHDEEVIYSTFPRPRHHL